MKLKLGIGILFLSVIALFLFAARARSTGSPQDNRFTTESTAGRYIVICNGYLSPGPNAPLLPAKLLGTVTADDGGTFTGSSTVMIGGGSPHTQTVRGTEQLNPDGTGTITYDQKIDNQQGPPLDITFIVSKKGDRIDGLATDPGTAFSCELHRTSKGEGDKN
jgi:hypothetical protein